MSPWDERFRVAVLRGLPFSGVYPTFGMALRDAVSFMDYHRPKTSKVRVGKLTTPGLFHGQWFWLEVPRG